ncbi:MAG: alkaline phosphatase, partial [Muribaculaceae bacterium]|nr:alkaline phosphatase [Muribaculaceae bacterium]
MIKIRKALLSLACAALASSAWAAAPKYIFYFIGDGMGPGQVMNAETYNRLVLGSDKTLTMSSLPVNSYATTYSASSPVTDSAAAGTALSTGHKTKNGMLGMNPDTIAVTSVAETLKKNGFGIGIITTVAADDATPGAFYAHVPNRKMYYEIGRQAAQSDYEVIAGASMRGASKNGKSTGLIEYIESNDVVIAKSLDDMAGTDSRRVMLLPDKALWEWNMGYTIDSIAGEPTLAQITSATIDHLMKHTPDRFFIMAEGGNIDHAGHANDGGTAVKEVLAFDQAIARALDFYNAHPDETLIVITADHETGGMSVGNNFTGYNTYPQYLAAQRMSKEAFSKHCDRLIEDKT